MDNIKFYMENIVDELRENHKDLEFEGIVVVKNNNTKLHGIVIREYGNNVAPTIYVEQYYHKNVPVSNAAVDIYEVYMAHRVDNLDMGFFAEYENIKGKLKAKLVNASNKDVAGISAERYGYDDLKIVPYVFIDEMNGSVTVLPKHLDVWGVDIETVVEQALENIKDDIKIVTMGHFVGKQMGAPDEVIEEMMPGISDFLVVSNSKYLNGAIAAIVASDLIKEKMNGDYVVIPSSIHEIIVVNKELKASNDLVNMVKEVNASCVEPADRLSDKVYEIAA